tara:strand:- start:920 stop:2014 length:1095 start_codon:yes stop_codon:yes gene_type:complete
MSYNILGIAPAHNSSICILSDGEIVYFLEEERLSKVKRDGNPFTVINNIIKKYKIDEIALAGVNYQSMALIQTEEDLYYGIVRKHYPEVKFSYLGDIHHKTHSFSSFYNSGFSNALSIVIDGNGSEKIHNFNSQYIKSDEIESIIIHKYPSNNTIFNSTQLSYKLEKNICIENYNILNSIGIGKSYEAISEYLGFKRNEGGKTMGLSSYGKKNDNIPTIVSKNFRNKKLFKYDLSEGCQQPHIKNKILNKYSPEDVAWKIQNDTQTLVGDYIENALQKTGIKQICCSGGYFLNCVANYYLIKRFSNIEFYFEPISNDAGTSIGAAKLAWHETTQDTTIRPQKTLYYGPKYTKDQLIEGIKKYTN